MNTPNFRKVVCLDFDGVLHSYTSGWLGPDVVADGPVPGAMQALMAYWKAGFKIAVFSSRSAQFGGIAAMKSALRNWAIDSFATGEAEDLLGDIDYPTTKPPAWLTIDDRAFAFQGTFPDPEFIEAFQPWNKDWHKAKD
jgi:hypothetical protein